MGRGVGTDRGALRARSEETTGNVRTRSLSHACVGAYYYDPQENTAPSAPSPPRIDVHAHSRARAGARIGVTSLVTPAKPGIFSFYLLHWLSTSDCFTSSLLPET